MRLSVMAGWVYSLALAMRVVGGWANRVAVYDMAREPDCAKSDLQTPPPVCRSSQNVVKMPVNAGVFISVRENWFSQVSQNLSQLVARMSVARKEQRAFRVRSPPHHPGIRVAPSGLRFLTLLMLTIVNVGLAEARVEEVKPDLLFQLLSKGTVPFHPTPEAAMQNYVASLQDDPLTAGTTCFNVRPMRTTTEEYLHGVYLCSGAGRVA